MITPGKQITPVNGLLSKLLTSINGTKTKMGICTEQKNINAINNQNYHEKL